MTLALLITVWAGMLGLVLGSYLNVVVHRLPRGQSTVWPGSHCPVCGTPIRPLDNLPVLSYLILRGRCRACRTHISWRYPALELTSGVLLASCVWHFGISWAAAASGAFAILLVALMGIDLEHMILPDVLTVPGIAIGLLVQPLLPWGSYRDALIGAAAGAGLLLAVIGAWYLVRRELAMGFGDVKMLAMIGAFLGWQNMAVALLAAAFSGALVGLILIATARATGQTRLPFGVFLGLGGLVALFWGTRIVTAYTALL